MTTDTSDYDAASRAALREVQEAIKAAEQALFELGRNLTFQVTPESVLEIVRHNGIGEPLEPKETVATLEGCDPMFWWAERPEGRITLGRPYKMPEPRCALTGRPLHAKGPIALYYQGRPVSAEEARRKAPLMVQIYELLMALRFMLQQRERRGQGSRAIDEEKILAFMQTQLAESVIPNMVAALAEQGEEPDELAEAPPPQDPELPE